MLKEGEGTFEDVVQKKAKLPLQIFTQHFNLRRPERYTRPHSRVAHSFTVAAAEHNQPPPNFSKFLPGNLIEHAKSNNLKKAPSLYANHVLTRIAYQAIGMADKLPAPLTQIAARRKRRALGQAITLTQVTERIGKKHKPFPKSSSPNILPTQTSG